MVLIVDDSSIIRRDLRAVLEENGHKIVGEAENVEEALAMYRSRRVDLVTMDIQMPGKSGIEAVRMIRDFDPQARIVMISSIEQRNLIFEAIKLGAKHYIVKPFSKEKVNEVIQSILPETLVPSAASTEKAEPAKKPVADKSKPKSSGYEKMIDPQAVGLPFEVNLENGKIVFTLYKYVTEHTLPYLVGCLQGLLPIYNAKFVIVLEKVPVPQDTALQPFIDFVRIVRGRRGTVAVVAEDNNQFMALKSQLSAEVYKSVRDIGWY